jgi:hypothetical protein
LPHIDLVGFGVTLAILKQLIKPIEFASMALRVIRKRQVPDLPLVFHDEAGFNA